MVVGPPDGAVPHVVVADVAVPVLDEQAEHHLIRVRRLRAGDRVTVTDGAGSWRWCRLVDGGLEPDGDPLEVARPDPPVTVAIALTKGERPDWTVQKLTEVGVDRILLFEAARSVVRWDATKRDRQQGRLEAIARNAVEQSGRCWAPMVQISGSVHELRDLGAVRMERGQPPLQIAQNVVAIGPEGGWSDTECELLPNSASLGPHVLRAETAAITAGAILIALRSGIVQSASEKSDAG